MEEMEEENQPDVKDLSIERILHLISYTSWLLGVGAAHPQKCSKAKTIIIRIFYVILCSINIVMICIVIDLSRSMAFCSKVNAKQEKFCIFQNDVIYYMFGLNSAMTYISTYCYIFHGIKQYNKWPELMDRLKELDQKIRKEISMDDQSIKIVATLAFFVTFFCFSISFSLYFFAYSMSNYLFITIEAIMLAQSLFNSFVFDIVVYMLYCRFQTINKLIGQLDTLSDVRRIVFKIRRTRELHTDVCDLASVVNDIYGLQLLFCLMCCFIKTVITLFHAYYSIKTQDPHYFYLVAVYICIVYVTQFYLICLVCTLAREESIRTGKIIYEIILKCKPENFDKSDANPSSLEMQPLLEDLGGKQSFSRSSSHNLSYADMENLLCRCLDRECVTKEINDFSIQLQQNRIAFTACNFFEINNSLFKDFVGLIFTYLFIFVQFYPPPN